MKTRLDGIRARLEQAGVDALLVSSADNRRYLSGFTGSAGSLIITLKDAVLATDFRYVEQASQQAPDFRVLRTRGGLDWLSNLLKELNVQCLGFEDQHMTVAIHGGIHKVLEDGDGNSSTALVATSGLVEELRAVKDSQEMAILTRAVEISDRAFREVSKTIQAGLKEIEVAWRLEKAMREMGAEAVSFETIVAAGPNAALPHHRPADVPILEGQPLIIDMGARYQGYCSDLSRTLCLGQPDDTFRRVYDTVLGAQLTAIATVERGMTGGDADGLARTVIDAAGYGENFGHSLGHGVGLEVHEQPGVGPNSHNVLEDGMPFTIEPGIYISGWGGVRIEDVVVLEDGRARVISKAPKLEMMGG
ncbi:aminopeptidase P family protein [SAR202 cluster bacterium AC-647-N09_OGT_505m]|nr:aminopeptidase P family protein [SAR202 cluster bacterium AC-647-N09_OGT_505m]